MRILYSHRIQSHDGQGVHIEAMLRAFRSAGHEVMVVGPGFYNSGDFGGESRTVARLRRLLPGAVGELAELAYNVTAYRRLAAAWRQFSPDFVYERYNLYYLAGALLARQHGVILLLEVNAPLAHERQAHGGLRLRRLARALERWTWRSADRVLAVTRVLADIVAEGGIAPDKVLVVPNGVDRDRLDAIPPQRDAARVTIGFVGFVRSWHRIDQVIAAMAARPDDTALVIVGDGPAIPELKQQADAAGLSTRIRFTGLVSPDALPAIVSGFDIALQPSATSYASPLKIFDYMAAGCAIVAPDQPNIREVLCHDETALLFDSHSDGSMWREVERLAVDATLRARLGQAARREVDRRDYTWQGNAARVTAIAASIG